MRRDHTGPRHILVIDDSEVLLARIKKALVDDGHVVTTTTQTVGNARHLATCDLVIVDYHMPGINGLAVQQAMRAAAAHLDHEPLFYLYTSDVSVANTFAELGFDGAFPKGDEAVLAQQVRAVFRLSQIRAMAQRDRTPSGTMVERAKDRTAPGSQNERSSRERPSGTTSERPRERGSGTATVPPERPRDRPSGLMTEAPPLTRLREKK